MLDPSALQTAPPAPRGPNLGALLVGIWVRPGRTLRTIAAGPAWLWLVPVALALVLAVGQGFASAPARDAAQRARNQAALEASLAAMPAEYRDTLPADATTVPEPSQVLTLWVPLALGVAGVFFGWLVRAAVLHISSLALGGQQTFGQMYRTSAWASFPLLLRTLVQTLYAAAGGGLVTSPGLSGLLPAPAAPGAAGAFTAAPATLPAILLGRLDLFTLWYLVLLAFAVVAASKLSRSKALVVAAIYAVLSVLTGLGQLLTRGITGD